MTKRKRSTSPKPFIANAWYVQGLTVFSRLKGKLTADETDLRFADSKGDQIFDVRYTSINQVRVMSTGGMKLKTNTGTYLVFFNGSDVTASGRLSTELVGNQSKYQTLGDTSTITEQFLEILSQQGIAIIGRTKADYDGKRRRAVILKRIGSVIAFICLIAYLFASLKHH